MLKSLSLAFSCHCWVNVIWFCAINLVFLCIEFMLSKAEPGFHFSECSYPGSNQGYIHILPRGSEPGAGTTPCATPVMATVTAAEAQVGILPGPGRTRSAV